MCCSLWPLSAFRGIDACFGAAGIWNAGARIQPRVSFEYELWGGAAIWSGNAINWRHKFHAPKLSRSLALEVSPETLQHQPVETGRFGQV